MHYVKCKRLLLAYREKSLEGWNGACIIESGTASVRGLAANHCAPDTLFVTGDAVR